MTKVLINWFKAEKRFIIATRGIVFIGSAPFDLRVNCKPINLDKWYKTPWVISHPKARKDCFYRVISVECWAMPNILKGTKVGILVRECHNA